MQTDDPQMFEVINQNPMAFMNILLGGQANIAGMGNNMGGAAMGGGAPQQQRRPPSGAIQVTQ